MDAEGRIKFSPSIPQVWNTHATKKETGSLQVVLSIGGFCWIADHAIKVHLGIVQSCPCLAAMRA